MPARAGMSEKSRNPASALRCAGRKQVFKHAQDGEHMHGISLMILWVGRAAFKSGRADEVLIDGFPPFLKPKVKFA